MLARVVLRVCCDYAQSQEACPLQSTGFGAVAMETLLAYQAVWQYVKWLH